MIGIVDVGTGNVNSVARAFAFLGAEYMIIKAPENSVDFDKIVFPGVGSFAVVSSRLESTGLRDWIRGKVIDGKVPILGICLGMQLLATTGVEGGASVGLDLIKAKVERLDSGSNEVRLPHIGWNDISFEPGMNLFKKISSGVCFYFVHSYAMVPSELVTIAVCEYNKPFVAAVEKGHIWGTQFHPEKSQTNGLQVLRNFIEFKN